MIPNFDTASGSLAIDELKSATSGMSPVSGISRNSTPWIVSFAVMCTYAESAAKFREIATTAGADVLLSNHTDYDGTKQKLPALAQRRAGAPHPYVVGNDSVRRYLTVANECAQAALASVQ